MDPNPPNGGEGLRAGPQFMSRVRGLPWTTDVFFFTLSKFTSEVKKWGIKMLIVFGARAATTLLNLNWSFLKVSVESTLAARQVFREPFISNRQTPGDWQEKKNELLCLLHFQPVASRFPMWFCFISVYLRSQSVIGEHWCPFQGLLSSFIQLCQVTQE